MVKGDHELELLAMAKGSKNEQRWQGRRRCSSGKSKWQGRVKSKKGFSLKIPPTKWVVGCNVARGAEMVAHYAQKIRKYSPSQIRMHIRFG
jgi:hypothetical protein